MITTTEKEDEIIIERKIGNLTIAKLTISKEIGNDKETIERIIEQLKKENEQKEEKIRKLLATLRLIGETETTEKNIIVRTKNMETTIKLATIKFNSPNSFIKEYTTLTEGAEINFKPLKYSNLIKKKIGITPHITSFATLHDIEKIGLKILSMEEKVEQLKKKIEKILSVTDEIIEKTEEITEKTEE
ncbi:MAG: hypothetical protein ACP5IZ_10635, partial [Thermoprotei archaeon]